MHIAHFLPKFLPTTEVWIGDILTQLVNNYQVKNDIYTFIKYQENQYQKYIENIYSYHDQGITVKSWSRVKGLFTHSDPSSLFWSEKIKQNIPDVCHVHFAHLVSRVRILIKKFKIPAILTVYGSDIIRITTNSLAHKTLNNSLSYYSKIICTSDYLHNRLLTLGAPKEKIKTVYLGVDTDIFTPLEKSLPENIITCVGRLFYIKGQEFLIKAIFHLKKSYPSIILNLIGAGPDLLKLKKMVKELKIETMVKFFGNVSHSRIAEIFQQSTIVVQPSTCEGTWQESFGMSLAEACSSGIPVIGTNTGGIPEIIIHEKNGLLVPEKDEHALVKAIERLLQDKKLREKYGREGRKRVLEKFNLSKQIKILYKIYSNL